MHLTPAVPHVALCPVVCHATTLSVVLKAQGSNHVQATPQPESKPRYKVLIFLDAVYIGRVQRDVHGAAWRQPVQGRHCRHRDRLSGRGRRRAAAVLGLLLPAEELS